MWLSCILLGLLPFLATAADDEAGPKDYRPVLGCLKAGDRLLLAPGDYTRGLPCTAVASRVMSATQGHREATALARPTMFSRLVLGSSR